MRIAQKSQREVGFCSVTLTLIGQTRLPFQKEKRIMSIQISFLLSLIGLCCCLTSAASAQEATSGLSRPVTAVNEPDADFDAFVSLQDVGKALDQLDAVKLAEYGAKLAEAERELGRVHKSGLSAVSLFRKALETATERKDAPVLAQVAQTLKQTQALKAADRQELMQLAQLMRQTSAESRTLDDVFVIDIESFSIDSFLFLRLILDQLRYAKLTQDVGLIDQVEADVLAAEGITTAQRDALLESVREARDLAGSSPQSNLFGKLAAASRGQPSTKDAVAIMDAQSKQMDAYGRLVEVFGERRVNEAKVSQMLEEVKSMQFDNKQKKAEVYFFLRKLNTEQRRERRAARRKAIQQNRAEKERYPSPAQEPLRWPTLLDAPEFESLRQSLYARLSERSPSDSGFGSQNYAMVRGESHNLKAMLKDRIHEVSTTEYLAATRFLNSLVSAAGQPMISEYRAEFDPIHQLVMADKATMPAGDVGPDVTMLAANTRSAEPARLVSVLTIEPEAYALYDAFANDIATSIEAGDEESLAALQVALSHAPLLEKSQRDYLARRIDAKEGFDSKEGPAQTVADVRESLARIAGLEPPLIQRGDTVEFDRKTRDAAFEAITYLVGNSMFE